MRFYKDMSFNNVPAANDLDKITQDFNCIIEIPAESDPVKYEVDHDTDLIWVDRFVGTNMRYPANYGYIPQTLCDDGDPLDVLVITPFPLIHGSVVRCRPLGVLNMTDESGGDAKLVAVPISKLCPRSEEHTSELQSRFDLVCRLLLEKKKKNTKVKRTMRQSIT